MRRTVALLSIFAFLGATGCSDIAKLAGTTQSVRSDDDHRSPVEDSNPNRPSDAALACNMTEWRNSKTTKMRRLFIPVSCLAERIEPPEANRSIDLVFVLDVTGSMGKELSAVRTGVRELIATIETEQWNLRAGAIAFADAIMEEIPISDNILGLLDAMSPTREVWAATGGFGGDTPEVGLAAIERGLSMLDEADSAASVGEKILVYVSDAPAEREHKKGFEISATVQALRGFTRMLDTAPQRPSFRMFHSTASERRGLSDVMPTPSDQIKQLMSGSGANNIKLPFPLNAEGLRSQFIRKMAEGKLVTERCTLNSAAILTPEKRVLFASGAIAESGATYFSINLPHSFRRGSYTLELTKNCQERGEIFENIALTF